MVLWKQFLLFLLSLGGLTAKQLFEVMKGYQLQNTMAELERIRSPTECIVQCTEMVNRHGCISISYSKSNRRCLLSDSAVVEGGGSVDEDFVYTILPYLVSYSLLPLQRLYLGSGIDDSDKNMVTHASEAERCYRQCFSLYKFNCRAFTYDAGVCTIPKQENPIQYLADMNIESSNSSDSYFMFSPSDRSEIFSSDSYVTLSNLCIRDGRSDNTYEMIFSGVKYLDACYRLCLETTDSCQTFSFHSALEKCYVLAENFLSHWTYVESLSGCTAYFLKSPNTWKLITKHTQYLGVMPDDSFNQDGGFQQKITQEDLNINGSGATHVYLKNQIIDFWDSLSSKYKIRMELRMLSGTLLKYMEYNAAGTTRTNWYSAANFLASSYTDLSSTGTYNIWEMADSGRTFYLSHHHTNCGGDGGWVQISASANSGCVGWDYTSTLPKFLYSPGNTYVIWNTGNAEFEVLLIYMSFN